MCARPSIDLCFGVVPPRVPRDTELQRAGILMEGVEDVSVERCRYAEMSSDTLILSSIKYFYSIQKNLLCNFSFESGFVVNNTNPMVPCEWPLVAVTHTHTPLRTARPPAAPPRRERDEEMGQQRRSTSTYGRVQLCATLPGVSHFPGQPRPFEAGK